MPYAPGINYDFSGLSNGIMAGASALAQGILAKQKKDDEDKDFSARARSTESFIKAHASDVGMGADELKDFLAVNKDETPRARYLRLSDSMNQSITGTTLKQKAAQEQRARAEADLNAKLQGANLASINQAQAQHITNVHAGRMAANLQQAGFDQQINRGATFGQLDSSKVPDSSLAAYLASGGQDAAQMGAIERLDAQRLKSNKPGLSFTDFNGRTIMQDANGNAHELKDPVDKSRVTSLEVGGKKFTLAGNHLLDSDGKPVTAPKAMDPFTAQGLYTQLQGTMDKITNSPYPLGLHLFDKIDGRYENQQDWEKRITRLKQDANMLSGQLGQQLPYPQAGILPAKPEAPADAPAAPTTPAASGYTPDEITAEIKRRRGIK